MAIPGFIPIWKLVGEVLSLQAASFQSDSDIVDAFWRSLLVVLLAGVSLALGQIIILFVNRVQPGRFVFSVLINAVLYTIGYLFLVFSTWLFCWVPWSVYVPFFQLAAVLGLAYAPLLFGFLGALPYFGVPILAVLSVWHLLAMVVGLSTVIDQPLGTAFGYVAIGWIVLQVLQRTIGQPIANLGRWLADTIAGVKLTTRRTELRELVRSRLFQPQRQYSSERQNRLATAGRLIQATTRRVGDAVTLARHHGSDLAGQVARRVTGATSNASMAANSASKSSWGWVAISLSLLGMALLAALVAIALEPLRERLLSWNSDWPEVLRFGIDLIWIGIVAIAFAGLLAPLETLGWWAGWYNDDVDTSERTGSLAEPIPDPQQVRRYVIYLDGVGQSTAQYTPDIETFLAALIPALPQDVALIRGLVTYSVVNNPLDEDRPLALLWQLADKARLGNPASILGFLVNLRNVLIVLVSADKRYGPLYNHGIAQIMYTALINHGYPSDRAVPVTLIGYSGGAQMAAAAAPLLRQAIAAPIDVISLGGVISGNCHILKFNHLYHLVGDRDQVAHLGALLFPGRWAISFLSNWNRAKQLGKISIRSLGAMGHQIPGGMLDPDAYLANGRSHLQTTVETIIQILQMHRKGDRDCAEPSVEVVRSML